MACLRCRQVGRARKLAALVVASQRRSPDGLYLGQALYPATWLLPEGQGPDYLDPWIQEEAERHARA
jgi:hypothetical protein